MSVVESAIAALEAWEDGYSIITWQLNRVLMDRSIDLQIDSRPPREGITLEMAAHRLSNALIGIRPYHPDLPSDRCLSAWTLGYLNGMNNSSKDITLYPNEEHIKSDIQILEEKRTNWTLAQLRKFIVDPVEEHAKSWRK